MLQNIHVGSITDHNTSVPSSKNYGYVEVCSPSVKTVNL